MEYGSVGRNLKYSYSKIIHDELGYADEYELLSIEPDALDALLKERNFKGLSVTIPYKKAAMAFCDHLTPLARRIGAINTLYFDEAGALWGTNTDYSGFLYAMDQAGISLEGRKVMILGNGATCGTIQKAALDRDAASLTVVSRKVEEPQTARDGGDEILTIGYQHLPEYSDAEIIINATPVGMAPDTESCLIDLRDFPHCRGVFDVVYNPYTTKLILQAEKLQIPYASGLSMLVAQATCAAGFFTGDEDAYLGETERVIEKLKRQIAAQ